jgi:aminobenzoyl-glutamate transport protein
MLPYTIGFGLIWIVQITVWFLLNLPLGPGANVFM